MLRCQLIVPNQIHCRVSFLRCAIRCISTNTAINRSLRKSSLRSQAIQPRPTRTPHSQVQDRGRPDRQRINDDDIGSRNGRSERRNGRSHLSRGLNSRSLDGPARKNERLHTRSNQFAQSKYDYSSKPGGNREARRAARFGRTQASPLKSSADEVLRSKSISSSTGHADNTSSSHEDAVGFERNRRRLTHMSREHNKEPERPNRTFRGRFAGDSDDVGAHEQDRKHFRILPRQWPERDGHALLDYEPRVPLQIHYTTPASEFLYGTSVVVAALQSNRRKLYKLYLYNGENREVRDQDDRIRKLARARGLIIEEGKGEWLRLMDKMSQGRPHNGYILEASPLPKLPATSLQRVRKPNTAFTLALDHQSREDEDINGTDTAIKYNPSFPRFPFVLFLDGILDPGNLGAILRSTYFLGVDAVAIATRNSAPFSPVALKASAGASENLPLMSVSQPSAFIDGCKANGWKIYAAVAPGGFKSPGAKVGRPANYTTATLGQPLRNDPCILILGGEGEGLRWNVQRKADKEIGVEGERLGQGGVDSLNVSVAAGILCDAFLRKPANFIKDDNFSSNSDGIGPGVEDRLF